MARRSREGTMPDLAGGRVISGERERSREMLLGRALRAAGGFAALGVEPGGTVALVLRNDLPFFEASYAARLLRQGGRCARRSAAAGPSGPPRRRAAPYRADTTRDRRRLWSVGRSMRRPGRRNHLGRVARRLRAARQSRRRR